MKVIVHVSGFTDWVAVKDKKFVPTDEDLLALKYKQSADGEWLARTLIEEPSHVENSIPPQHVDDLFAHFERIGAPKTRAGVVAWFLEEKLMPHSAPPETWQSIEVEGEPEIEKFLNNRFGLKESK